MTCSDSGVAFFVVSCQSARAADVLMTWGYNNTGGNLLAALPFHTKINFANIVPGGDQRTLIYLGVLYVIVAAFAVMIWGPHTLSRFASG